ncbi:twin-arginine translocase TatA/TatE family subunit [Paenibacillus gyeongsangnamensis]|uniref:twin-arginine translocase TatA/TatE family subunit n=1 Tax=Paenibacillus gyeongsangnamensis TaxID=3388067 RepID=UPI003908369F
MFGFSELLLIGLIALLLFGPNKLPELGRSLGKTIREFKEGARNLMADDEPAPPVRKDVTPPAPAEPAPARVDVTPAAEAAPQVVPAPPKPKEAAAQPSPQHEGSAAPVRAAESRPSDPRRLPD